MVLLIFVLCVPMFIGCGGGGVIVFTLAQAQEVFLALPDIPHPEEGPILALFLGTVEAGDVVGEGFPIPQETAPRNSGPLAEAGWLFYLDGDPGAFYEHPGFLAVISRKGEVLYQARTTGWPLKNNQIPDPILSPSCAIFHEAIIWNPWQILRPTIHPKDWIILPHFLRVKGAVVVNGLTNTQSLYTEAFNVHALVVDDFSTLFGAERVRSVASPLTVPNPVARVQNAVDDLINKQKVTNITFYFIAHGGTGGINLGGHSFFATDLRNLINTYPNIRFSVILETCRAGSWLPYFTANNTPNLGIFIATTSASKSAYPDWDHFTPPGGSPMVDWNPTDLWVEWTGDFLQMLAHWTSTANYPTVTTYATNKNIETEWALWYHCYCRVKWSVVPIAPGFNPGPVTRTMTERDGIHRQDPMVYTIWAP